jgi:hypothetical protein
MSPGLVGKRLALLKEMVPRLHRVALLVNPDNPNSEFQLSEAQAAAQNEAEVALEQSTAEAELRIQALPTIYPLGYPIAIRVLVRNVGEQSLPLRERLLPGFGMMQFEVRTAGSEDWRAVRPLAWYEPAADDAALLAPGGIIEESVPIYFGDDGWSFPEPGAYDVAIATNVLHATRNIRQALRHAKAALRRNGWLLLNDRAH